MRRARTGREAWGRAGLVAYVLAAAVGVLSPSPEVASAIVGLMSDAALAVGLPPGLASPADMHVVANVLVLTPVPVLAALAGGARVAAWSWRDWTAAAFVASAAVETVQALVLPSRAATLVDVVANTSGGLVGGLAAALVRAGAGRVTGRHRPREDGGRTTRTEEDPEVAVQERRADERRG